MIALLGNIALSEMSLEELQAELISTQNEVVSLMGGVDALKLDIDLLNRQVTDIEYQISITPAQVMGTVKQCRRCYLVATCCDDIPTPVANPKVAELNAQRNEVTSRRSIKETELINGLKEIDSLSSYQTQVQSAINNVKSDYALTSGLSLSSLLDIKNWPIIRGLYKEPEEGVPLMAPETKTAIIVGMAAVAGIVIIRKVVRRKPAKKRK